MATTTYEPIATTTLGSAASSYTFNSIPSTYTDLVIVASFKAASTTIVTPSIRFNGDTGSNYSNTTVYGTGSSVASVRYANKDKSYLGDFAAGVTSTNFIPYIISVSNYSNSTTYKTFLCRYNQMNSSNGEVGATAGLWRSTSAITSVTITSDGGQNFAIGSTFTLYGIATAPAPTAKATGGTITYDVGYTYHTFTSSGTFTPLVPLTVDYLVVAGGGGGGGGSQPGAGGGGAGGYRTSIGGTALSLTSGTAYTATVGAGGAAGTSGSGTGVNGGNSVFSTITSAGGGCGAGSINTDTVTSGSGGSGGGGARPGSGNTTMPGGSGNTPSVSPSQGNNGGNGYHRAGISSNGGGGGGASAAGQNAGDVSRGGDGGAGTANSISGSSVTYAGGGGGGSDTGNNGAGGAGGGGAGANTGVAGTANLGGGGGGSANYNSSGGNGGSGIVIVRYAN